MTINRKELNEDERMGLPIISVTIFLTALNRLFSPWPVLSPVNIRLIVEYVRNFQWRLLHGTGIRHAISGVMYERL
jgi:hypothetical protein